MFDEVAVTVVLVAGQLAESTGGESYEQVILHWNGAEWRRLRSISDRVLGDIGGAGAREWAVGDQG